MQRHALLVEKTPEIKIEPNRADAADAEAIADQAVGGAAARDPLQAARPAVLQKIPGNEKILLVTDLANDAQLLHHLRTTFLRGLSVTLLQTAEHQPAQELLGAGTVARREGGELRLAERKLELASLGNFERVPQPVGMFLTALRHGGGRAKVQSSAAPLFGMTLLQKRQRANALHDVISLPFRRRGVMNRRTRDRREAVRAAARRDQRVKGARKKRCQG